MLRRMRAPNRGPQSRFLEFLDCAAARMRARRPIHTLNALTPQPDRPARRVTHSANRPAEAQMVPHAVCGAGVSTSWDRRRGRIKGDCVCSPSSMVHGR